MNLSFVLYDNLKSSSKSILETHYGSLTNSSPVNQGALTLIKYLVALKKHERIGIDEHFNLYAFNH